MPVVSSDDDVTNLYWTLRESQPPFPSFQYGYLYATNSEGRRNVAVPVHHDVARLSSLDDLITTLWVPRGTGRTQEHRRVRVTEYPPLSGLILEYPYTIIFVPPSRRPGGPINNNPDLRTSVRWYGNILVLKHGKRKAVVNMLESEGKFIDNIVACHIELGMLR
ncbi:hypothetical protein C8J57DRAFT_1303541 [Mycena rebaudengoi]|nr:hypothetical protein C8J57DRAFT_1321353 [Mycena rebaudengoi]KAJ7279528.1 hypothetical protein C8J57DRAFT_1303541 [Mycena rebaudengoi]